MRRVREEIFMSTLYDHYGCGRSRFEIRIRRNFQKRIWGSATLFYHARQRGSYRRRRKGSEREKRNEGNFHKTRTGNHQASARRGFKRKRRQLLEPSAFWILLLQFVRRHHAGYRGLGPRRQFLHACRRRRRWPARRRSLIVMRTPCKHHRSEQPNHGKQSGYQGSQIIDIPWAWCSRSPELRPASRQHPHRLC